KNLEFPIGIIGVQKTVLRSKRAGGTYHNELSGLSLIDKCIIGRILLMKNQLIFCGRFAQNMLKNLVGTQGDRVLLGIEQGFSIIGPNGTTRGIFNDVWMDFPSLEVLHLDIVLSS